MEEEKYHKFIYYRFKAGKNPPEKEIMERFKVFAGFSMVQGRWGWECCELLLRAAREKKKA